MGGPKEETEGNQSVMDINDCVVSHSSSPDVPATPKTAVDAYLYLLQDSKYTDVTFMVGKEQKKIACHSVFLMARSTVFEAGLRYKLKRGKPIQIVVNDVSPDLFESFLKFIYSDFLEAVTTEQLLQLLELGLKYKVELLSEKCVSKLCSSDMTPEDAIKSLYAGEKFKLRELRHSAIDQLVASLGTLSKEPELLAKLDEPIVRRILERNDLLLTEVEVFNFLVKWGKTRIKVEDNVQALRETLGPLLPLIRFPIMSPEEFSGCVAPAGLLPSKTIVQLFIYFTATGDPWEKVARSLEYSTKPRDGIEDTVAAKASFSSNGYHLGKTNTETCEVSYLRECIRFTVNHPPTSSVSPVKTKVLLNSITLQWPERLTYGGGRPNGFPSETDKTTNIAGPHVSDGKSSAPGPTRRTRRLRRANSCYKANLAIGMPTAAVAAVSNETTGPGATNPHPSNESANQLQLSRSNFDPSKQIDSSREAPVDKIQNIFQTRPFSSATVNPLFRMQLKKIVERPGNENSDPITSTVTVFSANSLPMKEGETVSIEVNPPVELMDGKQNLIVLEEDSFLPFSGGQYRYAAAGNLETSIAVKLRQRWLQISDIHRNDPRPFPCVADFFSNVPIVRGMNIACSVDTATLRLIQHVNVLLYNDRK